MHKSLIDGSTGCYFTSSRFSQGLGWPLPICSERTNNRTQKWTLQQPNSSPVIGSSSSRQNHHYQVFSKPTLTMIRSVYSHFKSSKKRMTFAGIDTFTSQSLYRRILDTAATNKTSPLLLVAALRDAYQFSKSSIKSQPV